jgi:polyadenylate-binding protein
MPNPQMMMPSAVPTEPASLYVGDLAPEVAEAQLFELFNAIGPVVSIRVCRDAITRASLGYAYVNYQFREHAKRALEDLNFEKIGSRPCRIMWSNRDPQMRRSGAGNVFIKNLDKSIDHKQLYDTFVAFGSILSCKVATDENGQSRGYGFVHYETEEAARAAIDKVNGKMLMNRVVTVTPFLSLKERNAKNGQQAFTNVYVKNLPAEIDTEEKLREMFAKYGAITSIHFPVDDNGTPRGFGFVNFEKPEDAVAAVEALHGKDVGDDKTLFVGRAMKKAERVRLLRRDYEARQRDLDEKTRGVNLYVKHLDEAVTEAELRELFARFGTITSLKIMQDNNGQSRGFGFVCFSSPDEANQAISELHQFSYHGKPLYVALALRRAERAQAVQAQRAMRVRAMNPMFGQFPMQHPMAAMYQQMFPQRMPPQMAGAGRFPGKMPPQMPMRGAPQRGGRGGSGGRGGRGGRGRGGAGPRGMPPQGMPMPQPHVAGGAPQGGAPPQQPMQSQQPPAQDGPAGINASMLASAPPEKQKRILGEHLYPHIKALYPERCGKITGMLLEMENGELLHLLEDKAALQERAREAHTVLENYEKQQQPESTA